jgi:hypothetical protein
VRVISGAVVKAGLMRLRFTRSYCSWPGRGYEKNFLPGQKNADSPQSPTPLFQRRPIILCPIQIPQRLQLRIDIEQFFGRNFAGADLFVQKRRPQALGH